MKIIFAIVTLAYFTTGALAIAVMYKNELVKYTRFKMMTSGGFLLISLLSFLITKDSMYFGFLPGYILCFLGDFFLALAKTPEGKLKKKQFLLGLCSFVLAHIAYLFNLSRLLDFRSGAYWAIFGAIGMAIFFVFDSLKMYNFDGNAIPCYIYALMISAFLGMSFSFAINNGFSTYTIVFFIGALCFMLSDAILSLKYFGKKKKEWYIRAELVLYYTGMYLLSMFILYK